jgi:hypothetical protein
MTILVKDEHCNAVVTLLDGTQIEVFANQLLDKNLHQWKGWYCNAGVDRIVINDDFTVHSGRCLNDFMGNLLDEDFKLFDKPTICKQEECSLCHGDLYVAKTSNIFGDKNEY